MIHRDCCALLLVLLASTGCVGRRAPCLGEESMVSTVQREVPPPPKSLGRGRGALALRALDSWDGSPLGGVTLRVAWDAAGRGCPASEPPVVAVVASPDSGWVTVGGLRPGRYMVEARRSGLDPFRYVLWVRGGRDTATFVLGPATTR